MYCYIFQQQIAAVNKNAECKSRRWTSTCPQRPPVTCNTACQSAHSIPQHDKTHTNLRILQYLLFFWYTHTNIYTHIYPLLICVCIILIYFLTCNVFHIHFSCLLLLFYLLQLYFGFIHTYNITLTPQRYLCTLIKKRNGNQKGPIKKSAGICATFFFTNFIFFSFLIFVYKFFNVLQHSHIYFINL